MVYVDTSVLAALHLNESGSATVARWYSACTDDLVSAAWCVTEFASALSIRQRAGHIDASLAAEVWLRFERQCANDLQPLHVSPAAFGAAALTREPLHGRRRWSRRRRCRDAGPEFRE